MFQKTELARLRAQKNLLVLKSDMNRLKLAVEWHRLQSPERWMQEATRAAKRHPLLTAALAAAGGIFTVQTWRNRGSTWGGISGLGKLASTAFTVWKLARKSKEAD
jgi:hypothetical protein